ncbi:Transposase [Pseudomonas flavescens]|uniref:Transposase n=1 Tax=Phytopseudomonas flavescens TaxID=29435 RepID=A0A1G8EV73_9GAMM|nr:Transposase [Pseudomonas flavescens]
MSLLRRCFEQITTQGGDALSCGIKLLQLRNVLQLHWCQRSLLSRQLPHHLHCISFWERFTQGLSHAVAVTTAEITYRKGALAAITRCKQALPRVQSLVCDSGYTGEPFAEGVRERLGMRVTVQTVKRNELHAFKVMPKRWIAERNFAWLEKNRRLWKNCERKFSTSLQFIHLAFLALLLKRS